MVNATLLGCALAAVLLAGYCAQKYGLPPPPPKIAGIDLGTTFSSIGIYHAVTGETTILPDDLGKRSVPSVIAFLPNGTMLVGTRAVDQQERNPLRTIYDAKRFIGRRFEPDCADFKNDQARYPFTIKLDPTGKAYFEIPLDSGIKKIRPEEVGGIIIQYLKQAAEKKLKTSLKEVVISVPAEFDEQQRNATAEAAQLGGLEVRRVISEPTAAALAYGLHQKKGVEHIVVVDLGGGTLDVSVLWLQGGVFVTQAMAGNNRLGGQDLNNRVQQHLIQEIHKTKGVTIDDKEDLQQIRLEVEQAKLNLTRRTHTEIVLNLKQAGHFEYTLTREEFESLCEDLFKAVEKPLEAALADANISKEDVDEVVLVGGSTRIPRIRRLVGTYFGKPPNFGIDPELAVATGASVQAGVIGGGWPLQVAAMELPTKRRKRHFYTRQQEVNEKQRDL